MSNYTTDTIKALRDAPADDLKQLEIAREAEAKAHNAGRKPKFGDAMRNPWASERNPTRDGYFVRQKRVTGRFNPGLWYEMTDRSGKFWEIDGKFAMFLALTVDASEDAPFGYIVRQPTGHETYFKSDPVSWRKNGYPELGVTVHTLFDGVAPARPAPVAATPAPDDAPISPDMWITAQVARHLDSQYAAGFGAGWNAGIEGDEEKLRRVQAMVGTRDEYAELFAAAPAAPIVAALDMKAIAKAAMDQVVTDSVDDADLQENETFHAGKMAGILAMKMAIQDTHPAAEPVEHSPAFNEVEFATMVEKGTKAWGDTPAPRSDAHAKRADVASERESFEVYWRKVDLSPSLAYQNRFEINCEGNYLYVETRLAWEAWQARGQQAGAVDGDVKLPQASTTGFDCGCQVNDAGELVLCGPCEVELSASAEDAVDAKRYRYLRDAIPSHMRMWVAMGIPGQGCSWWHGEKLDTRIDLEIAQKVELCR